MSRSILVVDDGSRGAPLLSHALAENGTEVRVVETAEEALAIVGVSVPSREDDVTNSVKGIPEDTSIVIPRLVCRDPAAEIDFVTGALDAVELGRRAGPDGGVAHALLAIGPAMLMIEAEWPTLPSRAPAPDGSSPVVIFVYVEDVDRKVERAVALGAKVVVPLMDQFWGDRTAWIMDPAGHVWTIATRVEETTEAQRSERWTGTLEQLDRGGAA